MWTKQVKNTLFYLGGWELTSSYGYNLVYNILQPAWSKQ